MDQYKNIEGQADTPANPVRVSDESKHIQKIEVTIKQLQHVVDTQHREIGHLHREITRLKNSIDDVINMVRSRG